MKGVLTVESVRASQRSLHNAPIFRLLLKVAVKGTHQCDFLNFCGSLWLPTDIRLPTRCGHVGNDFSLSPKIANDIATALFNYKGCLMLPIICFIILGYKFYSRTPPHHVQTEGNCEALHFCLHKQTLLVALLLPFRDHPLKLASCRVD